MGCPESTDGAVVPSQEDPRSLPITSNSLLFYAGFDLGFDMITTTDSVLQWVQNRWLKESQSKQNIAGHFVCRGIDNSKGPN